MARCIVSFNLSERFENCAPVVITKKNSKHQHCTTTYISVVRYKLTFHTVLSAGLTKREGKGGGSLITVNLESKHYLQVCWKNVCMENVKSSHDASMIVQPRSKTFGHDGPCLTVTQLSPQ